MVVAIILFMIAKRIKTITKRDCIIGITTLSIVVILYGIYVVSKQIIEFNKNDIIENNDIELIYSSIDKTNLLIQSIAEVESGYDSLAVNKESTARGYLQILEGTVKDINRILKEDRFNCSDNPEIGCRFSIKKSEEMFKIYQKHYNPKGDIETAIRIWNGGPNYTKENTDEYFKKVMKVYNKKVDETLNKIVREVKNLNL